MTERANCIDNRICQITAAEGEGTITFKAVKPSFNPFPLSNVVVNVLILWDAGFEICEASLSEGVLSRTTHIGCSSNVSPGISGFVALPAGDKEVHLIQPAHAVPAVGYTNGRIALGVGAKAGFDNSHAIGASSTLAKSSSAIRAGDLVVHQIALRGKAKSGGDGLVTITLDPMPLTDTPATYRLRGWIWSTVDMAPIDMTLVWNKYTGELRQTWDIACWYSQSISLAWSPGHATVSIGLIAPTSDQYQAPPANVTWTANIVAEVIGTTFAEADYA